MMNMLKLPKLIAQKVVNAVSIGIITLVWRIVWRGDPEMIGNIILMATPSLDTTPPSNLDSTPGVFQK